MSESVVKRRLMRGLWILVGFLALVAATYVVLHLLAGRSEKKVNAAWSAAGLPLEGLLASVPDHPDSAAAKALTVSAGKLGIVLDTVDPAKSAVDAKSQEAWRNVKNTVTAANQVLESAEPTSAPVPELLQTFLQEKAPVLEEIRAGLRAEVPAWRSDISKGYRAEIPPLLGQLDLCRLFLADSQACLARGDQGLAAQDVDAVWRLSEGLAGRPELISQLVAMSMRRMAVVAVRHLDAPSPEWESRLAAYDPALGILTSFRCEAALMGTVADEPEIGGVLSSSPKGFGGRLQTALVRPYLRLCCAGAQDLLLQQIQRLRAAGPCAPDAVLLKTGFAEADVPWWNFVARIALPNMGASWGRAKHIQIQSELSRKVIALKTARNAAGAWPPTIPGLETSFCTAEKYTYTVTPEGGAVLAFSGPKPSEEVMKGFKAPQEYREGPKKSPTSPGARPKP